MKNDKKQSELVVFSHIPKTAGTSLNLILRSYFGSQLLAARVRSGAEGGSYQPVDLISDQRVYRNLRCISGHGVKPWVDFGSLESFMRWFTFVREPHKRFVSLYVHQQTNNVKEKKMDLLDWARQFDRSDGMVKMIAGEKNVEKAIDIIEAKMSFVGVAEYYDQSIQMLVNTLGLKGAFTSRSAQLMKSRDGDLARVIFESEDKYQDCIESNNRLDTVLYNHVKEVVWPRQLKETSASLNVELEYRDYQNPYLNGKYRGFQFKDKCLYRPLLKMGVL